LGQVKIYGRKAHLTASRSAMSEVLVACLHEALGLPREKRFQRFFCLEDADFLVPEDRGPAYTILEILMFAGRSKAARQKLIRLLYARFDTELGIEARDLEITLIEVPAENWGIRGQCGDALDLNYKIDI